MQRFVAYTANLKSFEEKAERPAASQTTADQNLENNGNAMNVAEAKKEGVIPAPNKSKIIKAEKRRRQRENKQNAKGNRRPKSNQTDEVKMQSLRVKILTKIPGSKDVKAAKKEKLNKITSLDNLRQILMGNKTIRDFVDR